MKKYLVLISLLCIALLLVSCGKKPEVEAETGRTTETTTNGNNAGEGNTTTPGDVGEGVVTNLVTIYFDFDKYNLRDDAVRDLRTNYSYLKDNSGVKVQIEGHCDERGTVEYNLALGEKRARAAMDYLASLGISRDRMSVISYGKERPASLGSNEDAWAKNRRAEFVKQ